MPFEPPRVRMSDFRYELPPERIAAFPLDQRDASRLLVCHAGSGQIDHRVFGELPALLPDSAMLIVNDTRVVRARLVTHKETGARVEIMLLEPVEPSSDPAVAMAAHGTAVWRCLVGGARRVRGGRPLAIGLDADNGERLDAVVGEPDEDGFLVRLSWPEHLSFAEVLERAGRMPLPPYIHRDPVERDAETYQTVYADHEGSVAAPTAGLHFTPEVFDALRTRGVAIERVTLHVGAGTFRPVRTERADEHAMHHERISVTVRTLRSLAAHARRRDADDVAPFVIVGTTSLRTVESLYWFGVKVIIGEGGDGTMLEVGQWDPYRIAQEHEHLPSLVSAFEALIAWAVVRGLEEVTGWTRIMIVPGYRFAVCDALITNFHQPESTLILLVGALLGRDLWSRVYTEALDHGYRFLSYGDSSMLVRGRVEAGARWGRWRIEDRG